MQNISGYELIEKIGEGGMGSVYRGRQVSLDRPVAIKVLSERLTDCDDVLERFNRESHIIAHLNHPNIIHVIDRGITPEGKPYFVMEHVEGTDLAREIKAGSLETSRKLDLIIQLCKALSYAHKNGVIHRDIKPDNVLIDADGNARVLDFGIAKLSDNGGRDQQHTQTDIVMGTMEYMSPEQRTATHSVTAASDLYSLGALMYELFTGVKPLGRFRRPSEIDPTIPQPLEEAILRCLEPNPEDRFASADEIKNCLLQVLQGAHLPTSQKQRAKVGLSKMEEKFSLLDVIKEDGYGAVYLYQDKVDHRLLVIKKRINSGAGLGEAKVLTNLKHKNVINILGASGDDRLFIIVMEYVSGGSLKDRLIQPVPWVDALTMGREICSGLSFAHRNRIVHGNLRPSNILLTESGEVKITDFGLDDHYASGEDGSNWYNPGSQPRSRRTDILAAGAIFYQMLTGFRPVWKDDQIVAQNEFKRFPVKLQEMITRMVSHGQEAQYAGFDQVIVEIDGLLAVHDEKKEQLNANQALTQSDNAGSAFPQRVMGKRLLQAVLLLGLLFLTAVICVRHADNFKAYMNGLLFLLGKLT